MAGKTREAAKAARMVSPSKRSPIKSKKRTTSRERKKRASKSRDNTIQNLESTGKHREIVTDESNKTLKSKLENQDELYTVMENINGKDLEEATLNDLRKMALAWKDFHGDETEILSMAKKELEDQLIEWSTEIKNRMEVDEVPPLQEAPNKGLDLSNVTNIQQLEPFSEHDLIKYLNRNRAGTQIGDMSRLPNENIHYLKTQTMLSIQYDRAKDIKATMKDTLNYLEISEYHEDQHKDLFVLRHHATNWKKYKNESVENIQNEEIKDALCDILEEARDELKSKKPPAFEMDLQTQIEMDENYEIKSEEEKTQVKELVEEILMKHTDDGIKKLFINNLRNLMSAWSKATEQDYGKIKNLSDEDMLQYALDTQQKLWDEYDEANIDENEEMRTFLDYIHDKETITKKDFEKLPRESLESLVFHKRMEHKDFIQKKAITTATTKELINQAINIFDLEKYSPTISETKYCLGNEEMTQNPEGITTLEKKQHLKNWNRIVGSNVNIDDMDEEYIDLEFKEAISKWLIHPDKKGFDERVKRMDKEMEHDEDQHRSIEMLPKLEAKMSNKDINSLNEKEALMVYKAYLEEKGFEEEQKNLENKTHTWFLSRITFVRDALYNRANELDTIFENEAQVAVELLQDTQDITASLTDMEIDNMDAETLAKVYYKRNKRDNKATKISGYFLWSNSTLKRAIRVIRDDEIAKAKKPLTSSLKPGKHQGKKMLQSTLTGIAMQSWRYSMSFKIDPKYRGTEGLKKYLQIIFQEMQSYDEGVKILLWNDNTVLQGIDHIDKFPKTITSLKKYFDNARPQNNGGQVYIKIRIGLPTTSDRETFETDFREWAKGEELRFYECTVQHHNTKSVGWLVYAPNSLNTKKWSKTVMKMYVQAAHNTPGATITLGLAWKALSGQYDTPQKDKLYAMHVESPFSEVTQVKRFLRILSRKKSYPLGVKFRLMSDYNIHMKEGNKEKHRYMVNKHRAFLSQIKRVVCTQVISLDKKIKNTDTSIRQIVTNIRDSTDNKKIFGSIDEHWRNPSECTVTYRPDKDNKAISFMRSLSTYVMFKYPDANLSGTFSLEAIDKARSESFDPNTQEFRTEEDEALRDEVESDLDDDSLDFITIDPEDLRRVKMEMEAKIPDTIIGGEKLIDLLGENETISTASNLTSVSFTNMPDCYVFDDQKSASSRQSEQTQQSNDENEKSTMSTITPISDLEKQFNQTNKKLNNAIKAPSNTVQNVNDAAGGK